VVGGTLWSSPKLAFAFLPRRLSEAGALGAVHWERSELQKEGLDIQMWQFWSQSWVIPGGYERVVCDFPVDADFGAGLISGTALLKMKT
jgi:hypothetical protein